MLVSSIGHFDVKNTINANKKRANRTEGFGNVKDSVESKTVTNKDNTFNTKLQSLAEMFSLGKSSKEKQALSLIG